MGSKRKMTDAELDLFDRFGLRLPEESDGDKPQILRSDVQALSSAENPNPHIDARLTPENRQYSGGRELPDWNPHKPMNDKIGPLVSDEKRIPATYAEYAQRTTAEYVESKITPDVTRGVPNGAMSTEETPMETSQEMPRMAPEVPLEVSLEGRPDLTSNKECKLSKSKCDLQLKISDSGFSAEPLTGGGFVYLWAGGKATHGAKKGKVCFDVEVTKYLPVTDPPLEDDHCEDHRHLVRIGWSTVKASLKLGQDKLSYGYGGTGQKSNWDVFREYGEPFGEGDVITAYLDLNAKRPVISYAKNGKDLGVAHSIKDLQGQALYPHVLTKNAAIDINLGQKEPSFPPKEDFTYLRQLPEEYCVLGPQPPASKEDCEVLMMIGFSGSGKTTWAEKHCKENPGKDYIILGTNQLMEDMKVKDFSRTYDERFDDLIPLASPCYNKLLDIASQTKHNYILDQTNVYPYQRRRKILPFEDFHCKAIVTVSTLENLKERAKRQQRKGKTVPRNIWKDMIIRFNLPDEEEEGSLFSEVEYVELPKDAAVTVLDQCKDQVEDLILELSPRLCKNIPLHTRRASSLPKFKFLCKQYFLTS